MTYVVDASVALKWVLNEAGSQDALALAAQELIAPPLFPTECANAIWKAWRRKEVTEAEATRKVVDLVHGVVELREVAPVEAFRLAVLLDHSVYDCAYLALAQAEGMVVVTADSKFAGKVERAGLGASLRRLEAWSAGRP